MSSNNIKCNTTLKAKSSVVMIALVSGIGGRGRPAEKRNLPVCEGSKRTTIPDGMAAEVHEMASSQSSDDDGSDVGDLDRMVGTGDNGRLESLDDEFWVGFLSSWFLC
jgi:hypothetical protein